MLVATKPVDFRKGGDGLAALVQETLEEDPSSGTIFIFRAKRAERLTANSSKSSCYARPDHTHGSNAPFPAFARHVRFSSECVAKLSLRLRLKRDSVDQDMIRGSGR